MRVAYFDCFAGVAGDMTVAALLSAGLPLEHLQSELAKLPLSGYSLHVHPIERSMIAALRFEVRLEGAHTHDHEHGHDHHHPGEARTMEMAEARILHRLRVPNPWKRT